MIYNQSTSTLYTEPKPPFPSLFVPEKLFVVAAMVLRSKNGKSEFMLLSSLRSSMGSSTVTLNLYFFCFCVAAIQYRTSE